MIIFTNKKKKEEGCTFKINDIEIEVVTSFNYLGIVRNSNGKFTSAVQSLKDKGRLMRALFKIHTILKSQKVENHIVSLKLFDSMVKPILLYGCQVWGNDYINYESKDIHHLDRIPFEEVQNKYCKLLLCVGRFTSNMAARAELRRHPLMLSVAALQIKFWSQILKIPPETYIQCLSAGYTQR